MMRSPVAGLLALMLSLPLFAVAAAPAAPVPTPVPAPAPAAQPAPLPTPPELAAKSWILIDAHTGQVLVERNADERLPPASLTKLMTSYLIAEEIGKGKFTEQTEVPISVKAWRMGGSKMFVREGSQVPVGDLLRGIIIQSGNDATVAMAEHIAGSEESFAQLMNQNAVRLGMTGSHFQNASGWPADDHFTTARDMATLLRAMIREHPDHYRIYAEKYFEYNGIRQPNRNLLLWRDPTVDGGKTGHTEAAGYCLVASALRDDMRLISVVMGTASEQARAAETQKLLGYGFRFYETAKLYQAGEVLQADARVWFGKRDRIDLVAPETVYLTLPRGTRDSLKATLVVDEVIRAPLTRTTTVGTLKVENAGEALLSVAVVPDQEVAEAGFFARLWDHLMLFLKGLFS
ncbi:MAG TPA: D-alanyl-D-alanine carboxypeptidase family protein [Porticoccaceae bacterium]|nr:D-alanyl-D-alanine carboxypeptidase family protein [Porticoccaceae bacterium]